MNRVWVSGWLVLCVVMFCVAAASGQKAAPQTHTVQMHNFAFEPAELTVNVGDAVEWKNADMVSHTVTAADGSFDSGKIAPGGSWKLVAKKRGTHAYKCLPHPNMHGTITVK